MNTTATGIKGATSWSSGPRGNGEGKEAHDCESELLTLVHEMMVTLGESRVMVILYIHDTSGLSVH